jgi:hypothetical protein
MGHTGAGPTDRPAADVARLPGDEAGTRVQEKDDGVGDVRRRTDAASRDAFCKMAGPGLSVGIDSAKQLRGDRTGSDGVHGDALSREF